MVESTNPLIAFSNHAAQLVERTAASIVAVHGGARGSSSGIHWRSGVIVTAEEVLERDEDIKITLPDGRLVEASFAGRDPSTDVAVLRFQADGLPTALTADSASLRPGHVVMAIGNHAGVPVSSLGIVAMAGGPWQSMRGGTIDSLIRVDLTLTRAAEGGALVDAHGHTVGMAVLGPRRRALAIPTSTINRVVEQLLAKGHVFRGYLGAGLQPLRRGRSSLDSKPSASGRGVLVVSVDPDGPAARAGLLVGDIVMTWNAKPIDRVREVMHLLGADSVGTTVDLQLIRGGAPTALKVVIGERPVAEAWGRMAPPHSGRGHTSMTAIAIFSTDAVLRRSLEQLLREEPAMTVVGVTDDPSAVLQLISQTHVDIVLVDALPRELLADWQIRYEQTAFVVLVDGGDEKDSLDVLYAGARAILLRSAEPNEIVVATQAVVNGLAVLPRELLSTLLNRGSDAGELLDDNDVGRARLTPRELEVLAAMANGASNKAIARRLGISFHTAKFHVAAILAKLDADSRTEAVTRAAQLGLVML